MRAINYKVRTADGSIFSTTSYSVATESGNRIVKTYLTKVDLTPDKVKEARSKRVEKLNRIRKAKRG